MLVTNTIAQLLRDLLQHKLPVRMAYRNRFGLRALRNLAYTDNITGYMIMQDGGIVLIPADLARQSEIDASNRMLETWRELAEKGSGLHLKLLAILSSL